MAGTWAGAAAIQPGAGGYTIATGIQREDLFDQITIVAGTDSPFVAKVAKRDDASAYIVDWGEDDMPTVTTAGSPLGAQFSAQTQTTPSRKGNAVQIFASMFQLTKSQVNFAKKGGVAGIGNLVREYSDRHFVRLWNNMERRFFDCGSASRASSTASGSSAGMICGSIPSFLTTNAFQADGTALGGAATTASASAVAEVSFNQFVGKIWDSGGNARSLFANRYAIEQVGKFTGNSVQKVVAMTAEEISRTVYAYNTYYTRGAITFELDRWVEAGSATGTASAVAADHDGGGHLFLLDLDMFVIRFNGMPSMEVMGKRGLTTDVIISCEASLMVMGEKGMGRLFGIPKSF